MKIDNIHYENKPNLAITRAWAGRNASWLVMVCFCAVIGAPQVAADEVTKWNRIAGEAAFASGLSNSPLFEARVYALTQAAVHDALNSIDRRYRPYAFNVPLTPGASPEAAVATAAHHVLVNQFALLAAPPYLFAPQQAMLDAAYAAALASIPQGSSKADGIKVGEAAAAYILNLRANDGWNQQLVQDFNYPQGTAPGEYRYTPPNNFVFLPKWGTLPPFTLHRSDQYRPSPPYKIDSKKYTADYDEIKRLGGNGTTTPSARTADQTAIARFWYESSPLGWNRIARTVSEARGVSLWDNARLFALLNLAMADGYIANFDSKFFYNYWRPITAIRLGNDDGNSNTVGDPQWTPLLDTPPVPDYASGHSVEGGVAAEIMRLFFGTDRVAYSTCSTTMPIGQNCGDSGAAIRSFTSFSQAEAENGLSRILVGIHFRKAVEEGIKHGNKLAHYTFVHYLRSVR